MKSSLEKVSECKRRLIVTVSSETANDDYKKVIRKYSKQVNIPGFRKGKAPTSMIEQMYGEGLKSGFIEEYAPTYYLKAIGIKIKENGVSPIGQGTLEDWSWKDKKDLELKFTFEVKPRVELKNYDNLEIEFVPKKVTKKMIDEKLEELQKDYSYTEEKDSPAEKFDKIFYTVQKFGTSENTVDSKKEYPYLVGSGQLGAQFDKDLIGKKSGDAVKSTILTPSSNRDEKPASTDIELTITSVKKIILPKLDDEFAKDASDFDTLASLKKDIKSSLELSIEEENEESVIKLILQKLIDENKFEVPESLIENYLSDMMKQQGAQKMDEQQINQFKQSYKQLAIMQFKQFFIMEKLRELEKIVLTDEEIEEEIKKSAEAMNMELESYKKLYKKKIEDEEFKQTIINEKIIKKIGKRAKFVKPKKKEKKIKEQNHEAEKGK